METLIHIYDKNERNFNTLGIGAITDAYDIETKLVQNGEHSLIFTVRYNDKKARLLQVGFFVKVLDDIFIIRKIEDVSAAPLVEKTVYCEHLLFELMDKFIPFVSHRETRVQKILDSLVENTRFKADSDVVIGGYNFQLTKGNALNGIFRLAKRLGAKLSISDRPNSEGFFTLFFSIRNKQIGKLVHNRTNLASLKRIEDGTQMVTRLYVYGEEDMGIEFAQQNEHALPYIDSVNASDFPIPIEGAVEFDSINDPDTLYEAGLEYLQRMSVPTLSYEAEMEELTQELGLTRDLAIGDEVIIIDEDINARVETHVAEIHHILRDRSLKVSLAEVEPSADKLIAELMEEQTTEKGILKGNVWTEWLTVPFTTDEITIIFDKTYKTKPVLNAQVYGDADATVTVNLVEDMEDETPIYTGATLDCIGEGTDVAIQVIGRV